MAALWTSTNQQAIKPISANNLGKFDNLALETQIKDLKPLIGFDMFQDLLQNPTATANKALLDGGEYTYNGVTYEFKGLIYVLCYFFYANYVMTSWYADTFTGFVAKNHDDAQPASSGDKKNLRDLNVEIAMQYWEDCKHFIAANSSDYPYFLCTTPNRKMIIL
jgi:hypothetical protein